MLEFQYMDPNFDVTNMPCFNNVDGLKDISCYLDFGIKSTIHKQIPNITPEAEKYYAKIILKKYMDGDKVSFTSQYGIRQNVDKIGYEKIKALLLKTLIEKGEYNRRVLHLLTPQNFEDQCADYITNIIYSGQLEANEDWILGNIGSFIDIYVNECYDLSPELKDQREELCYGNSVTTKALEQLNLEMKLNSIKN